MTDTVEQLQVQWEAAKREAAAEIDRLNIRIRQDAEAALQHLNEIDQLTLSKAALQTEIERLRALGPDDDWEERGAAGELRAEIERLKAEQDKAWTKHLIEREDLKMALIKATAEIAQFRKLLQERNDEIARLRGFNTGLATEVARLKAEHHTVKRMLQDLLDRHGPGREVVKP